MTDHLFHGGIVMLAALATALAALMLIHTWRQSRQPDAILAQGPADDAIFLFDGGTLVDATAPARRLLADAPEAADDRARLLARLGPRFPDLAERLEALPELGVVAMRARGDALLSLTAEWRAGLVRLTLTSEEALAPHAGAGFARLQVMEEELAELRGAVNAGPVPVWRETASGQVTWANRPYLERLDPDAALGWPLPRLFEPGSTDTDPVRCTPVAGSARAERFDCHRTRLSDGDMMCHALPAENAARAEAALGAFRKTLTHSFAQLPMGIAVFDAARRLQIFNPALIDMTGLDAAFLSARPGLAALLDRLRDSRVLPEPRDYPNWRRRVAAIDAAAATGDFEETWNTPAGQTLRVLGRPHPDGAIALIFSDVSADLALTRRYRAEVELGHEVLDSLDEAIAVFSPGRHLLSANAAYARLWGVDPAAGAAQLGLAEAMAHWRDESAPGGDWERIEEFARMPPEARSEGTGRVALRDGSVLDCRVAPLSGGAFLVGFRGAATERSQARQTPKLVHARPH